MSSTSATLAGRYALEEEVARGGMASVWRAQDEVLARTVAIKILHPHLADDEAFLERFRREALAAARLTHPNVVAIYDTGSEPGPEGESHFIVMEYCGGGTLGDLLHRERVVGPDRVAAIGATICDALAYAHANGIVHRDIKPANVLVANDGSLKVADFGIAKAAFVAKDITTTGSILGTVTYLSPEQAKGEEPTACSDIYSLGVVLYELATGRPPFAAESGVATAMKHIKEEPLPPRSVRAGVPKSLEAVILKCLAKDPADRYPDARAVKVALEAGSGATATFRAPPATGVTGTASAPSGPQAGRGDEWRWVIWLVALIAAAAAITLFAGSRDDPGSPDGGGRRDGGAAGQAIEVDNVIDFDPHGGDGEHPDEARFAVDGNATSAWSTSSYQTSFATLGKPGVGLLFDLGEESAVSSVEVTGTPGMEIEIRAGSSASADETGFEPVAGDTTQETSTFEFEPVSARYWLVWITELPGGGGGSASIGEVRFLAE